MHLFWALARVTDKTLDALSYVKLYHKRDSERIVPKLRECLCKSGLVDFA